MLEILTFTGVDERTDFGRLTEIAVRWPRVEFGVLVGSQIGGIFPTLQTVRRLAEHAEWTEQKVAIHLCGKWSRDVMAADGPAGDTYRICRDFGRVQVNLHGDTFNSAHIDVKTAAVMRFADNLADGNPDVKVILQHRGSWDDLPLRHDKVEYLFDRSGGAGRAAFEEWPIPENEKIRYGYAGGIGPDTIWAAMAFVNRYSHIPTWLDMEGRVRTDGWFDLEKVEAVCAVAFAPEEAG